MIRDKKEIGIYLSVNEQISTFVSDSCACWHFVLLSMWHTLLLAKDFVINKITRIELKKL